MRHPARPCTPGPFTPGPPWTCEESVNSAGHGETIVNPAGCCEEAGRDWLRLARDPSPAEPL
eukprot:scaffold1389_cov107-Isochrysis_galbana.AAC.1